MTALFQEQGTVNKTALAGVQPALPAKKVRAEKKVIVPCKLTDTRAAILTYLIEWRFGTTNQLWRELHKQKSKLKAHTTRDLEKLRAAGLVTSFRVCLSPDKPSELCWLITKAGVTKMQATYNNRYVIRPSRERILLRDMELKLIRDTDLAGWKLICPTNYSPSKPMPKQTPQYYKLAETIDALETIRVRTAVGKGEISQHSQTYINCIEHQHLWGLPGQVNDYVAFVESYPGAVAILILCPPSMGEKAWKTKLEKYSKYAKYLPVYGIFADEESRVAAQRILGQLAKDQKMSRMLSGYGANLKTAALNQVYEVLDEIAARVIFGAS